MYDNLHKIENQVLNELTLKRKSEMLLSYVLCGEIYNIYIFKYMHVLICMLSYMCACKELYAYVKYRILVKEHSLVNSVIMCTHIDHRVICITLCIYTGRIQQHISIIMTVYTWGIC